MYMSRAPFTQLNEQSLMRLRKSANIVCPDSTKFDIFKTDPLHFTIQIKFYACTGV